MLIDIHAHLDFFKEEELKKYLANFKEGIILTNGVNSLSNRKCLEISEKFENVRVSLGLYPTDSLKLKDSEVKKELEFIKKNKNKIIAIGEIGLDLKESDDLKSQEKIFRNILDLANEIDKPIIIHSRKAEEKAIEILEELKMKKVIMHCFCGKKKLVERIIENGWSFSIPANVKFSEQFQDLVRATPIEQLFCETDSPFLHPDKKFPNEPANVFESYKKIGEIKGLTIKQIEKKIEDNFKRVFEVKPTSLILF